MTKIFKKILSGVALACGCLLFFTGCHGKEGMNAFAVPEEFDASREYEVTFWAKNDTNKTQTAIYEKAIADFEALYPNITVNLRLYTDYYAQCVYHLSGPYCNLPHGGSSCGSSGGAF